MTAAIAAAVGEYVVVVARRPDGSVDAYASHMGQHLGHFGPNEPAKLAPLHHVRDALTTALREIR